MRATITVPIYNAEKTLEETLSSIAAQTVDDFEVLLIDDCSTDDSPEICRRWETKDSRFRYIRNKRNSGPAATRNVGICQAQGDWLLFVDSDDLVSENYVERLTSIPDADVVWCNFSYYFPHENKEFSASHGFEQELPFRDFIKCLILNSTGSGCLWNKAYKKSYIDINRLFLNEEKVYGEDGEFNMSVALKQPKVFCLKENLYKYTKYTYSVSHKYFKQDIREYEKIIDGYEPIIKKYDLNIPLLPLWEREVYYIISLMYKLAHSTLSDAEKSEEFDRIFQNKRFREMMRRTGFLNSKLTLRQKVTACLARLNLKRLTWLSLKI